MTTHLHSDTPVPSVVSRLLLRSWVEQSGALSALPDAPVVAARPRRGRGMRARRRHDNGSC